MATSFQEITLDTRDADDHAVLVLRNGRLAAVLSHLSDIHGDMAGMWFVETMFGTSPAKLRHTFNNPDEFVAWLDDEGL